MTRPWMRYSAPGSVGKARVTDPLTTLFPQGERGTARLTFRVSDLAVQQPSVVPRPMDDMQDQYPFSLHAVKNQIVAVNPAAYA